MTAWSLAHGEVVEVLRDFKDNSFDALLCDPPYGFSFMGKSWDYDVPSVPLWRECLRVLKPGAPLVAFGGSRTYHRLACGIEDAGFELRDCLMWLYGKGFPKSQNIALAIDKAAGAVREVIGTRTLSGTAAMSTQEKGGTYTAGNDSRGFKKEVAVTAATSPLAKTWDGWGTALKPAHEPIVLARKPLEGTMVQNVSKWGVGGLAIDACRIGNDKITINRWSDGSKPFGGGAGHPYEGHESEGRWPANLILSHTESCRPTGQTRTQKGHRGYPKGPGGSSCQISQPGTATTRTAAWSGHPDTEVEVWDCSPDCPVRLLDEQGTYTKSVKFGMGANRDEDNVADGNVLPFTKRTAGGYSDAGGPSRFFYCAKVSTKEREAGCEGLPQKSAGETTDREDDSAGLDSPRSGAGRTGGARNFHPCCKPIALIKWLATLIKPPSPGVLLVPFSGSGSEMIGSALAGWPAIFGIEREREYVEIARTRLRHWVPAGEEAA